MGKKTHRGKPGGRRRFLRALRRKLYAAKELDPSVSRTPQLSVLPPPEEILAAIAIPPSTLPSTTKDLSTEEIALEKPYRKIPPSPHLNTLKVSDDINEKLDPQDPVKLRSSTNTHAPGTTIGPHKEADFSNSIAKTAANN